MYINLLVSNKLILSSLSYMGRDATKGTIRREKICIACSRGFSAGHFGTKIMYLTQFLTELLRTLSFKTCIMKN